jgi:hypothetical protein
MNFSDFYAKWGTGGTAASLNEGQGAQPHFMDLCALLGIHQSDTRVNSDCFFDQTCFYAVNSTFNAIEVSQ